MTRQFQSPVRLIRRRPRRVRPPHTLSFTCFHLVAVPDPAPGEDAYAAIEMCDPAMAMRHLAITPRSL
jgi:hypothetical protein